MKRFVPVAAVLCVLGGSTAAYADTGSVQLCQGYDCQTSIPVDYTVMGPVVEELKTLCLNPAGPTPPLTLCRAYPHPGCVTGITVAKLDGVVGLEASHLTCGPHNASVYLELAPPATP